MATGFRARAVPVDAATGDKRRIDTDYLTHQALPMPARWVREDVGAHDNAVSVASGTGVDIEDDGIWITGHWFDDVDPAKMPRLAEDVAEAMFLAREGVIGISVDLDDYDATFVNAATGEAITEDDMMDPSIDVEQLITKGRIRSVTFVPIPAYAETNHTIEFLEDDVAVSEPDDTPAPEPELAIVASVSGDTDLPVAARDLAWDGNAAAQRVLDAYTDEDGNIDKARASRAFLWVDGDGQLRGDYRLGFADIIDGELTIVPRGVSANAGGHGVDQAKGVDKEAVKSRICALYARVQDEYEDWPDCPFGDGMAADESMTASAGLVDISKFTPPVPIDAPTRITYDYERGMVYGHIYQDGVCHVGFPGECRMPPMDEDFRHFHIHPVETTAGTMFTGRITVGGFHPSRALSLHETRRAYDDKTTVAHVQAKIDEFGIFICGPLETNIDHEARQVLRRRKVSGHWPEVGAEGSIYLAEILALPEGPPQESEPGFPIGVHVRNGRVVGLTAALGPSGYKLDTRGGQVITAEGTDQSAGAVVGEETLTQFFRNAYKTIRDEESRAEVAAAATEMARQALAGELAKAAREDLAATLGGVHV